MAETDWTVLTGGSSLLDATSVARGVTAGSTKPRSAGSNNFVYGWNSLLSVEGATGLYNNRTKFAPLINDASTATGGSIRAAIMRAPSGGTTNTGFAPMLFINLTSTAVESVGYVLGLEDNDPHRIVLKKSSPSVGLSATSALRISQTSYLPGTWLHLRLDAIFNTNGDVVLNCYQNNLVSNYVETPDWQPILGMPSYIDDVLGVNSGSVPLTGGYTGFAFYTKDISKRAYIDQIEVLRQK